MIQPFLGRLVDLFYPIPAQHSRIGRYRSQQYPLCGNAQLRRKRCAIT